MTFSQGLRGILLFGCIKQIILYIIIFLRINHAVRNHPDQPFLVEKYYSRALRIQEKIFYGKSLTYAQRQTVENLRNIYPDSVIQGVLLGKNLSSDGEVVFHAALEVSLAILGSCVLLLSLVLLIGVSVDISQLPIGFSLKFAVISSLGIFFGIPCYVLGNHSIAPVWAYSKLH